VKKMCAKCKVIKRAGVVRVLCSNPKHKQRQGLSHGARLAGVDIPNDKRVLISLTYIHRHRADHVRAVDPDGRT